MSTHQQQCNNNPADLLTQVHSYICDHLEQAQLLGTRGAFVHECGQVGLPCQNGGRRSSIKSGINEHTKSLIFQAFDNLDYPAFFEIWNNPSVLPHGYGSKAYVKLNFRLHLHFNCQLVVVEKSTMEQCMQNIRHFFDREGSFLASEQEFIHYFALPFVMEPTTHPSFKGLFEKNNWMRLRSDLSSYLDELRERGAHESELAKLIRSHHFQDLKPTDQLSEKESELERMRQVHAQLVSQHQKLRNDHQKLIAVTKELTTALELAARSASSKKALQTNTFTWSSIVLKCGRIYPELFSNGNANSTDNHRASTAIGNWEPKAIEGPQSQSNLRPKSSPLERKVLSIPPAEVPEKVEEINENEEAKSEVSEPQVPPPPEAEKLNYSLMQRHVTVELGRQSLLLLQALRWLLTRSNNGQRKVFLNSYLRSDILGLKVSHKNSDHQNPVMQLIDAKTILENPQAMFQQSVVRLMNAMASIKSGRDYLGNYKNVVGVLINSLIEVSSMDQFTIDMIVATLQKLSLKYLVRRQLIESGMLEWLIDHLKQFVRNENHLSCYGLEYSTALFMNLCLHRSGKLRCLPMAQEVLNTFLQLLSSSNKRQILPYVNGTLYSLLTNPKIAATARQLQFSEKLKLAIAATANDATPEDLESDEEARQQISFVLQQYEESSSSSSSSENSSIASSTTMSSLSDDGYEEDEESNDEDVDIEDEVDLYDPVVAKDNELSGNALLCAYYLLEDDQENECKQETDPKIEKILEEELELSSSSSKSSSVRSTTKNTARKTSSSEGNESPRREPCSFFISTSPPLPGSLKPQLSSDISSISTESTTTTTTEVTVKENEIEAEKEKASPTEEVGKSQTEVTNNKTNSSDTDEGVVLVMEDRLEPPKAPVKRPKNTKYRSKSMSRKSSTSSSSAGSNNGKTRSRQHSATKKGNTTSSKTRSSPVRTTTELLPKIGPSSHSPPIPAATSTTRDSGSSASSSSSNNSKLLSKVAAAMPLLPPLPMDIDQAKHAAEGGGGPTLLAIEDKSEKTSQQGALFTVAGADAFTDVFEDENTTLWKLENGDAKMTMSLTDEKLESRSYVPPPSPRKRWRKLEPVTLKTTTLL